jgi:hypothetical protein
MNHLEQRIARLESRSWASLVGVGVVGLVVGGLIGSTESPSTNRLVGTGLTIVDTAGRPVIDLAADANGAGRIHVRNTDGTAEVVVLAGPDGGAIDLFSAAGQRQARLGSSPTGDGMLVLTDMGGSPVMRLGRWELPGQSQIWVAPLSEPSTP